MVPFSSEQEESRTSRQGEAKRMAQLERWQEDETANFESDFYFDLLLGYL